MKILLVTLLALTVVYCASKENLCSEGERKKKRCPTVVDPLCAISETATGQIRTLKQNRCFACIDPATSYVVFDKCDNIPQEAIFCDPKNSGKKSCPEIFKPVCGYFDFSVQCFAPPCAMDDFNSCLACAHNNISYYIPGGQCPPLPEEPLN